MEERKIVKKEDLNIIFRSEKYREKAFCLSSVLGCASPIEASPEDVEGLSLVYSDDGLSLCDGSLSLKADFSEMIKRLKPNNLNGEMLVRAAKIRSFDGVPTLIDATAGLGEDSFLLAASGFRVKLYERDAVICALLGDALERASAIPEISEIVSRMELFGEDSVGAMKNLGFAPDVILLDPMFPERQKSALIKKKFQLLQKLEMPCTDEKELFEAALSARPYRIIIKRPAKGEYLAGRKPHYSIDGKAIRYDCFVFPENAE